MASERTTRVQAHIHFKIINQHSLKYWMLEYSGHCDILMTLYRTSQKCINQSANSVMELLYIKVELVYNMTNTQKKYCFDFHFCDNPACMANSQ